MLTVAGVGLGQGPLMATTISSTHQPVEEAESSVPSRKRKSRFCPAYGNRLTITWPKFVPLGFCPHAMRPASGLPKLELIVPLYPPWVMLAPASCQVAPLSVEVSNTPPSK